jgi:hypothetical protein
MVSCMLKCHLNGCGVSRKLLAAKSLLLAYRPRFVIEGIYFAGDTSEGVASVRLGTSYDQMLGYGRSLYELLIIVRR